jgi:ArsR family transcriptional regulator
MKVDRTEWIRCDCTVIHEDVVQRVQAQLPEDVDLFDLAEFFKVFGDTTRIKILTALSASELCVCDLAVLLNMTQSAVSHQLRMLKQSRLVKYRKAGKIVYYSLDDAHVNTILEQGHQHLSEELRLHCPEHPASPPIPFR